MYTYIHVCSRYVCMYLSRYLSSYACMRVSPAHLTMKAPQRRGEFVAVFGAARIANATTPTYISYRYVVFPTTEDS